MVIGVCKITLRLPENYSLKDKREVVRSITTRVRNRFNVSISEVADNDLWQILTPSVSIVSTDVRRTNKTLSQVMNHIQNVRDSTELVEYEIESS